ncbi:MAG: ferrous iron transporter B [Myxococcota bacterium]|nr:ferrous iron transporter B [Myxococcota bacterium]
MAEATAASPGGADALESGATAPLLGLIGSPNSGKTTLFNALTGLRARVGNYPGVTVERREGFATVGDARVRILDLPGTYSLTPISADEAVVSDVLAGEIEGLDAPDGLVIVADANSLDRSLLFVAQALRLGRPACLVLTMMDELRARGGDIDCERLANALGIPVIPVVGHRGLGLDALRKRLAESPDWEAPSILPPESAEERAGWARSVLESVRSEPSEGNRRTEAIDRIVLHPLLGSLLFVVVMTTFFQLIFTVAAPLMDAIDAGVGALAGFAREVLPAGFAADLLADGVIAGVGSVVIFLPQIVLLFTLLYFLEDSGYMARAAFVIDRVMARVGLEGRAFVALLSSYACAVPGIMAARTVPSPRHRLVTILVAPLMTCSARLPVYAILIAAFVPVQTVALGLGLQGLVLLTLYLAGTLSALLLAALLRRFVAPGEGMPFYLELPPYRVPPIKLVASQVWGAASAFLKRAGTIILAASIILWVLLNFPKTEVPADTPPERAAAVALEQSAAGRLGHAVEPLIAPLGFDWKIGVGLVASLAAREVIVATLAQIYATAEEDEISLREALQQDRDPRTGELVFDLATVASLLVFFVFALQCVSTLAVMRRETASLRWPAFSFVSLLAIAYGASFVTYRVVHALTT